MDYTQMMYGKEDNLNYYCKDDLAYTEDYVLVHNIYAYKIPKKVTQNALLQHFSQYGKVIYFNLVSDKKHFMKVAFVHFEQPKVACKVLLKRHQINRLHFKVKACDSWRQPNAQFGKRYPFKNPFMYAPCNVSVMPNVNNASQQLLNTASADMLRLNDDCLEQICQLLSFSDQLRFALTCKRFQNAFLLSGKSRFRTLNMEDLQQMTLWEIFELLKLIGSFVVHLEGHVPFQNRERIFGFLCRYVNNVVILNFDSCKITAAWMRKLVDKMPLITDLGLKGCFLNDAAIGHLQRLTNLQSLTLTGNTDITGKNIASLTWLKNLYMCGCSNVQTTHMIAIIKALNNLQTLDIRRCDRLGASIYNEMLTNCANLETLKISFKDSSVYVAQLPKLQHLELEDAFFGSMAKTQMQMLEELVKHKAQQLKVFKIATKNLLTQSHFHYITSLEALTELSCPNNSELNNEVLDRISALKNLENLDVSKCKELTNAGLLRFVKKCAKLKVLNIKYCNKIDSGFILDVIPLLKSPEHTAELPLILHIKGIENIDEMEMTPFFMENKDCLDIRCGYEMNDSLDSLSNIDFDEDDSDDDVHDEDFYNEGDNFFDLMEEQEENEAFVDRLFFLHNIDYDDFDDGAMLHYQLYEDYVNM